MICFSCSKPIKSSYETYLSAYLSVLSVFSHADCIGDMLAIIQVLEFPRNESRRM